MPTDSSKVEPGPEATDPAAPVRAALEAYHERLLRSVAVMVSKTEPHLPWAGVMDLAREVLDEAAKEALAHTENFDPGRSAVAWLRGIAARVLLGRRRADARSRRCVTATALGEEGWEAAVARLCTGPPDATVGRRLDIEQALARIRAEERQVIELRYYQGLDGRELAEALGVSSPGAARVRLCRALRALRGHFPRAQGEVLP
jgi:RNA polymerase sigma factor (sigma-70 family)